MFGNWGHFEPAPKLYPNGWKAIRAIAEKCQRRGIRFTMYTLTDFIKPKDGLPEPFITPHIDPRFAAYDIATELLAPLDRTAAEVRIKSTPNLAEYTATPGDSKKLRGLLWIGDELIAWNSLRTDGNAVVFSNCKRGELMSTVGPHKNGTPVKIAYYSGYDNLFPGTLEMNREVATIIGKRLRQGDFTKLTLDGHESALATGLGYFAMNDTLKTAFDLNRDRDVLYTGSRLTNYCWHMISYISWGEFDLHKGFRGTMLDYRINRQLQLARSFIPKKMGQHYLTNATLADINWLMGTAAGWDSGVEFSINPRAFKKNPQHDEIVAAVQLWEKARRSGTLTEKQKLVLRQIDCVSTIAPDGNGAWKITSTKRWRHPDVEILPPSSIKLENLSDPEKAQPTAIDISWTHSPLVYSKAAISNDMPLRAGRDNFWRVTFPAPNGGDICGNQMKVVLRVPDSSPAGIRNPVFTTNKGRHCMFPVTLHPGESLATPVNAPLAFVYNSKQEVIAEIHPRYRNSLPGLGNDPSFIAGCRFESVNPAKSPVAILNILHGEIIRNKK